MLGPKGQEGRRDRLDRRVRADGRQDKAGPRFVRFPAAQFHQHPDGRLDPRPRIEDVPGQIHPITTLAPPARHGL
jgi:hypothetical protein